MRERMAKAPSVAESLAAPSAGDINDLTSTSIAAFNDVSNYSTTFVVSESGVTRTDALSPICAPIAAQEPAGIIDYEDACANHLLLLSDEVDPEEIEALALSMWDGAAWVGPGRLQLVEGAQLEGPWGIDFDMRQRLKTPAAFTKAWVLRTPPTPRKAVPAELLAAEDWAPYFPPDGVPVGVEYRILVALKRVARRLGGALRVHDSGRIMHPDPDSSVSLSLYTSTWLDPDDLLRFLKPYFPGIIDSRDVPVTPTQPGSLPSRRSLHQRAGADTAHQPSEAASTPPQATTAPSAHQWPGQAVVSGYALLAPIANRSRLMLRVHQVSTAPQVLRWESWTSGVIIEYAFTWLPQDNAESSPVTRTPL